jgi:asparagine synthase (glutamine-hydrolysing)
VSAALVRPFTARYDATNESPYLRAKAQVVRLFPQAMQHALPRRKRTYRAALAAVVGGACPVPFATAIGLLDAQAVIQERDTATRMMVAAVEHWLVGAVAAGITVPS